MAVLKEEIEAINDAIDACLDLLEREEVMLYEALQSARTAQGWREKSRECVDRELEMMESDESLAELSNIGLIAYDIIGTVNGHCFTDYARNHAYDKLLEQIEQMMFGISLTDARAAVPFQGVMITEEGE